MRATAARLRCHRCNEFGAPYVGDGRPTCEACWFRRLDQPPPMPRQTDQWAASAVYVGRIRRKGGRGRDVYRYEGREATLAQWALAMGVTRQALWLARMRVKPQSVATEAPEWVVQSAG